ncbi:hypothetical Protein YC6258_00182 [Gynuella sunshinyii YC6258]|uniref:Uncharacterized protein n=1 Tax=Gynuella sunshinyii YC6258 TaxID=1445510 RepID=A0A0C5VPQ4_9GAMM|nr:hypothetical Protein YC6258_00182 [Gynuella sunshinyii YC6258]
MTINEIALEYRARKSLWNGYVIVFDGTITGWTYRLDYPQGVCAWLYCH